MKSRSTRYWKLFATVMLSLAAYGCGGGSGSSGDSASTASPGKPANTSEVAADSSTAEISSLQKAVATGWSFAQSPNVNDYWLEVSIAPAAGRTVSKVELVYDGRAPLAMSKTGTGSYALNQKVLSDQRFLYRAWDDAGAFHDSGLFKLSGAQASSGTFAAVDPFWKFSQSPNVNDFWIEVSVTPASGAITKVEAIVNGSRWLELGKTAWGSYALNTSIPKNASVFYRAWDDKATKHDSIVLSLNGTSAPAPAPTPTPTPEPTPAPEPAPTPAPAPVDPPKSQTGQFNYGEAYQMTPLFFAWNAFGTLSDRRIPQRKDSRTDGDLSGGYADAGDNILFGNAHNSMVAHMGLATHIYKNNLTGMGQLDETLTQLKHGTDWLLKSHEIENGKTKSLVVQLGDSPTDHPKWVTIEESTHARPVYRVSPAKPGSDYAGLAAAAMAFGALNFSGEYRDRLIASARIVFEFGKQYRGLGQNNGVVSVYKNSNGDEDELALGAMGLYLATGETSYLDYAERTLDDKNLGGWTGGFEHQEQLATLLIAHYGKNAQRATYLREYFNNWKPGGFGGQAIATGEGYVLYKIGWGSAGAVAPALNYMGMWHTLTGESTWTGFVQKQMDYNLGANSRKTSLMCGFRNEKNCSRIHHRGAAGGSKTINNGNNLNQLWGGWLAGPTSADFDWKNDRNDWKGNEPTITYNVNFQGALAYLYGMYGGAPMADAALQDMINKWSGY